MKLINNYGEYEVDGKKLIIISENYQGCIIFYDYDVLIGPKHTIEKFKKELFACRKKGWKPIVRYI